MAVASPLHSRTRHIGSFGRHLLEMAAAMMIGMVASAAIFVTALGTTVDEALRSHAVLFVVVQALGMTVAMVAWMRHRGHGWRACVEMTAAMVIPAVPLIFCALRASSADRSAERTVPSPSGRCSS